MKMRACRRRRAASVSVVGLAADVGFRPEPVVDVVFDLDGDRCALRFRSSEAVALVDALMLALSTSARRTAPRDSSAVRAISDGVIARRSVRFSDVSVVRGRTVFADGERSIDVVFDADPSPSLRHSRFAFRADDVEQLVVELLRATDSRGAPR